MGGTTLHIVSVGYSVYYDLGIGKGKYYCFVIEVENKKTAGIL